MYWGIEELASNVKFVTGYFVCDLRQMSEWIWISFRESLDKNIILLSLDLGMLDIWISDPFRRREWRDSLGTAPDQIEKRKN